MADVIKVENGRLIIDVELHKPVPSASGKTLVVYSTHGNQRVKGVEDDYFIGVNLYQFRR